MISNFHVFVNTRFANVPSYFVIVIKFFSLPPAFLPPKGIKNGDNELIARLIAEF